MSRYAILPAVVLGAMSLGTGMAAATEYTTFDIPNSYGMWPVAINAEGIIAGTWEDNSAYAQHGFLRAPDGSITSFDPAGSVDTEVRGMSRTGAVVGRYQDGAFGVHGFIRKPSGKIVELLNHGIVAADSINSDGDVCGVLGDDQHIGHPFVRTANGKVT